jgi:hypothetical protein
MTQAATVVTLVNQRVTPNLVVLAGRAAFERVKKHRLLFRTDWLPFIDAVYFFSHEAWEEAGSPTTADGLPSWLHDPVQIAFKSLIADEPWRDYFQGTRRSLLSDIRKIGDHREAFLTWFDLPENEALREHVGYPETLWSKYQGTGEGRGLIFGKSDGEFYTPPRYIEFVREVLGGIDLDPASCEFANRTVKARNYFTKEYDGLSQEWRGKLYLNAPYSRGMHLKFISKLIEEYRGGNVTEAIMLTGGFSGASWFTDALNACSGVCFTRHKITFIRPDGAPPMKASAPWISAFFYFGPDVERFETVFSAIGSCLQLTREYEPTSAPAPAADDDNVMRAEADEDYWSEKVPIHMDRGDFAKLLKQSRNNLKKLKVAV